MFLRDDTVLSGEKTKAWANFSSVAPCQYKCKTNL